VSEPTSKQVERFQQDLRRADDNHYPFGRLVSIGAGVMIALVIALSPSPLWRATGGALFILCGAFVLRMFFIQSINEIRTYGRPKDLAKLLEASPEKMSMPVRIAGSRIVFGVALLLFGAVALWQNVASYLAQ